eukprot:COSAG01_NODE_71798_length_254_cov_7.709677_1_plen_67_part_10
MLPMHTKPSCGECKKKQFIHCPSTNLTSEVNIFTSTDSYGVLPELYSKQTTQTATANATTYAALGSS